MSKTFLRLIFFLNINQKGLGFQGGAGHVASVAIGLMSVGSKQIFKVISYHHEMAFIENVSIYFPLQYSTINGLKQKEGNVVRILEFFLLKPQQYICFHFNPRSEISSCFRFSTSGDYDLPHALTEV